MRKRFHNLKRPKVRQDWSKWTLYNLSRLNTPNKKTFFQQKWAAKSMTRAYHGEQIREKQWTRMFNKKLPAVATMNPQYMAQYDGSEQAEGRGSGRDKKKDPDNPEKAPRLTPYMQMTYFPMERRLDVALWRALFASSTRQARQFVVHGWVTVNGKPMRHPSYLLNPGDMFQIDPERVMFATGAKKENNHRTRQREAAQKKYEARLARGTQAPPTSQLPSAAESDPPSESLEEVAETEEFDAHSTLKSLLSSAKEINTDPRNKDLSVKRKQEMRAFRQLVKKTLSKARTADEGTTDNLVQQMAALKLHLTPKKPSGTDAAAEAARVEEELSKEDEAALAEALERVRENPRDPDKPYLTPWRPRNYMSAFAFIPRYLEVNQNICAAVYLRHPVARPGLAEVPTPFSPDTSQLAFNWYLRRR